MQSASLKVFFSYEKCMNFIKHSENMLNICPRIHMHFKMRAERERRKHGRTADGHLQQVINGIGYKK